jgi:hypothetical protein
VVEHLVQRLGSILTGSKKKAGAQAIRYHESTDNEGLENYWTTQSDGDEVGGDGMELLMLDCSRPPSVGHYWIVKDRISGTVALLSPTRRNRPPGAL